MTPQSGKQIIAINISTNISRRKDNQTMTFNMTGETYFIKNHSNVAEKLFPDFFLKNQN